MKSRIVAYLVVLLVFSLCVPAVSAGPLMEGEDLVSMETAGLDFDLVEAEPLMVVFEPVDSEDTEPTVVFLDVEDHTAQTTINTTPIIDSTNNLLIVFMAILPIMLVFGLIGRMKGWF